MPYLIGDKLRVLQNCQGHKPANFEQFRHEFDNRVIRRSNQNENGPPDSYQVMLILRRKTAILW